MLAVHLLGVVGENNAAVGRDSFAQSFDPFGQKEHHGGVVVFAAAVGPPSKRLRIGSMQMMSGGTSGK